MERPVYKEGLYWAKTPQGWDLMEVRTLRDARFREPQPEGHPDIELYVMGWDCPFPTTELTGGGPWREGLLVPANFIDPDGNPYEG